jgi:hypothetical protein
VTDNSLIYLTPTGYTGGKILYVKSKERGLFTVAVDSPTLIDIPFNWWIIELTPETKVEAL